MIEQGLFQFLSDDDGVSALANGSIYEQAFPKDEVFPGVIFYSVSSTRVESLGGENGLKIRRFQFDCYDKTARGARTLQKAVRSAFEGIATGTTLPDGSVVQAARILLDMDKPFQEGSSQSVFCSVLDIEISFVPSS